MSTYEELSHRIEQLDTNIRIEFHRRGIDFDRCSSEWNAVLTICFITLLTFGIILYLLW